MELIHKTIGDCLTWRAGKTPDKEALIHGDRIYTWSQTDSITDALAMRMDAMGIKKGTHVGIWGVNTQNWIFTFLALEKLGAVPALINACYKGVELRNIVKYADLKYVFYGEKYKTFEYAEVIDELKKEADISDITWCAMEGTNYDSITESAPEKLKKLRSMVTPEDIAGMLFTSGTTSTAKGVLLSHYNLINSAKGTLEFTEWTEKDRLLLAVPMFHCFGVTSNLLASILTGSSIYIIEYFKTLCVMEMIDKHDITVLSGVPSMFLAMINKPEISNYSLKSLKSGIIAGSAISEKEYNAIIEKIPGFALLPSYGQTETSPCVTLMLQSDPVDKRAKTAGRLISLEEMRFTDPNTNEVLPQGVTGEIQVRGYNIMQGYYNMPEATKEVLLPDGWLRTGDLGYMDEDGYLYVSGRIKEMIIRAGENISPHEIESYILEVPNVFEVKVVGIPTEVVQEEIVACIIPKNNATVNEEEIRSYLASKLAHYKIPSHILVFKEFPVTASGKVLISELKKQVIDRLGNKVTR